MGMGFPMGTTIPWESHGNGNETQNWEWEWEGMGHHLSGNGNYLHSHGNLFPKVLCCDELIKLLVLYLPDANAYCAEFADYRNVIYSAPCAGLCIPSVRQTSTFPFPVHCL